MVEIQINTNYQMNQINKIILNITMSNSKNTVNWNMLQSNLTLSQENSCSVVSEKLSEFFFFYYYWLDVINCNIKNVVEMFFI